MRFKEEHERLIPLIGGISLIVLFISFIIYTTNETNNLASNGQVTIAKIYDIGLVGRGYFGPLYRFEINGKEYKNQNSFIEIPFSAQYNFLCKTFPVIYMPKEPNENHLLITPSSFEEYGLQFPDSLKWVCNFIR